MCDEWGDSTDLSRQWVKARKEHKCFACQQTIQPGELYHRTAAEMDGTVDVFKHCATCWQICVSLWAAGAQWVQYDLKCGERWEDNFGELPDDVAALAFETRDEAQERARLRAASDSPRDWASA